MAISHDALDLTAQGPSPHPPLVTSGGQDQIPGKPCSLDLFLVLR